MKIWLRGLLVLVVGLAASAVGARAQESAGSTEAELYKTVAGLDAKLFEAYNHCDLATLGTTVSDDLEFYHDKTGLQVGKEPFLSSIKQYICGKVQRDLTPGSLEVHVLKGYGAVEIGSHRFHHPGHDDTEGVGEAKFVMLWRNKDGKWTLTRVISYDHAAVGK
jgi:hypothetical protein